MSRNDAAASKRMSTNTSIFTTTDIDSAHSSAAARPFTSSSSANSSSRRGGPEYSSPTHLRLDRHTGGDHVDDDDDHQEEQSIINEKRPSHPDSALPLMHSPSSEQRQGRSPSHRRRGRDDDRRHPPPSDVLPSQMAPWMVPGSGSNRPSTPAQQTSASFYDDSSDTQSTPSQASPRHQPAAAAAAAAPAASSHTDHDDSSNNNNNNSSNSYDGYRDSPESLLAFGDHDDRRPSLVSIATVSSQGSKASMNRGGLRKLQGFFGEEFPGRDSSDNSLATSFTGGRDRCSRSYSHQSQRDRKPSNATSTDQTRDVSPSSSRPRSPVPAPEVVPFLYQDNSDIALYGEAPVRNSLAGLDRDRYKAETQNQTQHPPKTSSSARSGHSNFHLPGHHHRHNRSHDDQRSMRIAASSRDESANGSQIAMARDKGKRAPAPSTRSGADSPTPSASSIPIPGSASRGSPMDGNNSPPTHHSKFGLLGRFRKHHKDKDDAGSSRLKSLPQSTRSLQTSQTAGPPELSPSATVPPSIYGGAEQDGSESLAQSRRGATFNNRFPFSSTKKKPTNRPAEDDDEHIGPTDRSDPGHVYHLDTNLNDMEGILSKPPALAPIDLAFINDPERRESVASPPPKGRWDAPDSWAVRRGTDDNTYQTPELDETQTPPRDEEKLKSYCIRIFRSDGTFSTHSMPLNASVTEVISQVIKKTYVVDGLENYHIILRKQSLIRVLGPNELPLLIQKRLLQQVGYEERDRIGDLGREDNSYLCRFMFLSAKESDFHSKMADLAVPRNQKLNYVDLSARNLITIPISLYSRAADIISLNLSRNLSLDVPRDFIQSCKNLRDIKFNNNEARRLPPSLSRAGKLTYLDVSNNRVEHLEHAELDTLSGVLKMNLANNRLKSLPPYFGAYQALRSLNISSNFLDEFPRFLCDLQSLVDLDLSFNTISQLPDEIGNLKNLEKLLVTNNRLSHSVPRSFADLISLRELDIKYNGITSIDVISELPKLEILYADHNGISAFTGRFERLRQLKLNSNPLNKFEIEEPIPTLKSLNLSNAQLASIDSAFHHMPNLENLVLDKNYFVSLPAQIGTLLRLEHFSIANNSVGELPPQIGCLTELRVLNVRNNNLSRLPMEIWWAKKLEVLNASSNILDHFPKPASRPPRVPGEDQPEPTTQNGRPTLGSLSSAPSSDELAEERRPSQGSSTLLSVGTLQTADRKSPIISVYGKGGRQTSVISRKNGSTAGISGPPPPPPPPPLPPSSGATAVGGGGRKDSSLNSRLINTFAGSLRNLSLADNSLDDDVFDQITLLAELRVLNLSYNDEISDMPQRSIKSWPQLVELYLSGNGLTTLPAEDLEESSLLQALYINGNKFTNLPADISRAKKLAVLDCGNNYLKYNISNVPYDWNWNLNPNLRYLNLSGNKKLEIKQSAWSGTAAIPGMGDREQYADFSRLTNLRVLGLMDVTLTQPSIPDQSEDRRVRTSGSLAGHLPYGMADTLGRNEHLSTVDLVVPRFNSSESEMLLGLFDGQALSSGGSKIAKYLHENFGNVFAQELKGLRKAAEGSGGEDETPADALRRAFLAVNKDLATITVHHAEDRPRTTHRGSAQSLVLSKEDLASGGVATVAYLRGTELYVANVGDAQAMVVQNDGYTILTRKHDPAEPSERSRIREAGGWVSRNGRLNDTLEVSRAFGYSDMMPIVQAAPHVSNMTVRQQDEAIVLATKEFWEYLSPGLVSDIARAERQDLMRAAQKLRDLAIAYGASGKIMVMVISVADLKRRVERSKMGGSRGPSMSLYPSGIPDDAQLLLAATTTRRPRKGKGGDVLDSSLNRLEAEIPAPTGNIAIVFTDIKNSTMLWEMCSSAMRSAIKLHNDVMRRQLRRIGGYEVKTEGDAFMVSFPTATSALLWCFAVQLSLLTVDWPAEVLSASSAEVLTDKDDTLISKGLSVRMGIHYGDCVSETDPVTRRMDYFGPMVNKASRISAVADGGQITVSSDFISEIQRCLETYQDTDRDRERRDRSGSDEMAAAAGFDEESYANSVRKDLRSLTSQGFEVKEMGEKKLKGLENPEVIYSIYPHALAGRIEYHQQNERRAEDPSDAQRDKATMLRAGAKLDMEPNTILDLWRVGLRLEMLCSTLEEVRGPGLRPPPESEFVDRLTSRGGEMTESFLVNFMEHQISRIETCVTTLTVRHLARVDDGPLRELNQLRGPMASILDFFAQQKKELDRYRELYGDLPPPDATATAGGSGRNMTTSITNNSIYEDEEEGGGGGDGDYEEEEEEEGEEVSVEADDEDDDEDEEDDDDDDEEENGSDEG